MRLEIDISTAIMIQDSKGRKLEGILIENVPTPYPKLPGVVISRPHLKTDFAGHLQSAIVEFCLMNGLSGITASVATGVEVR